MKTLLHVCLAFLSVLACGVSRAYVPVSMLGSGPSVLAVPAASPASTLQDLISPRPGCPGSRPPTGGACSPGIKAE